MVACPKCGRPVGHGSQEADWKRQVKETVERHKAKRRRQSSKHEEDARQLTIFPDAPEDEQDAAERQRRAEIRARVEQRLKRPIPKAPARAITSDDGGSAGRAAAAAALPLELEAEPVSDEALGGDPGGRASLDEPAPAPELAELEWSTGDGLADESADSDEAERVIEFGLATPAERLIGGVIDVGFVALIQLTLFYLTTHLVSRTLDALPTSAVVAMSVVGALLAAAYFLFFWSLSGQTLGKLLTGCRVVDSTGGGALGASRAMLRLLAAVLSLLPLGAGLLGWWTDPERRGWHDRIASTHVVRS